MPKSHQQLLGHGFRTDTLKLPGCSKELTVHLVCLIFEDVRRDCDCVHLQNVKNIYSKKHMERNREKKHIIYIYIYVIIS